MTFGIGSLNSGMFQAVVLFDWQEQFFPWFQVILIIVAPDIGSSILLQEAASPVAEANRVRGLTQLGLGVAHLLAGVEAVQSFLVGED